MTAHSLIIYLGMVAIATFTPGPAVLFIVTNSTLYGWKKSVFAALGNISGLLCMGIISVSGLGAILKTSQVVFDVIKYLGAAYLIFLGFKMIFQKNNSFEGVKDQLSIPNISSLNLYIKAFGVAVSNPKAIIFLTALFPQFIDYQHHLISQFLTLIAVLILFSFSALMMYAVLASRTKRWLTKSNRVRNVNRIGGSIFIGFGFLLAASSRQ